MLFCNAFCDIEYLKERENGTPRTPPEKIVDESPLLKQNKKEVTPMGARCMQAMIHKLCLRAGLITKGSGVRGGYEFSCYSLRRFFRTEMSLAGVNRDCIEYMMGHKGDPYCDIKSRGVEYLRAVYANSGLSLKSRTKEEKIEAVLDLIHKWGITPEEIGAAEKGKLQTRD